MTEKATFAAGCFWQVEADFRRLAGVVGTRVGYTGGGVANPSYEDVCYKNTGHAEAVEVTFDPARVSYEDLLELFWANHDPTQLNRQGPDVGEQYRSAIFVHSEAQTEKAQASKKALEATGLWARPIVTVIEPAPQFFEAEDYHQRYLEKRGMASCTVDLRAPAGSAARD